MKKETEMPDEDYENCTTALFKFQAAELDADLLAPCKGLRMDLIGWDQLLRVQLIREIRKLRETIATQKS